MKIEQICVSEHATLTAVLHEKSREMPGIAANQRTAMIVCPGGAYTSCSDREADPPAIAFLNMGFQVFILRYAVGAYSGNKQPLRELAASVKLVRENAENWLVDDKKIVVCGFSAGGHLAASLGVHWNDPEIVSCCGVENPCLLRPDAMVLGYPVITSGEYAHQRSIDQVKQNCQEDEVYWSLEKQVSSQTPPAFIWHTMNDQAVPVENTILFAQSLHRAGVECECHLFADGPHGMTTATPEVGTQSEHVKSWVTLCEQWLSAELNTEKIQ